MVSQDAPINSAGPRGTGDPGDCISNELSCDLGNMCLLLAAKPEAQWDLCDSLWSASQGTCFSCLCVGTPVSLDQHSNIPESRP